MNDLTMVTDETEFEPMSGESNPKPVTVQCPICGKIIEIPEHNSISRSDALKRHLDEEHTSNHKTIAGSNPKGLVKLVMVQIPDTNEYKVKWIENDVFSEAKSYYTDDFDDAVATSIAMAAEAKKAGFDVLRSDPELLRPESSNPDSPLHEPTPGFSNFHTLMLHAVAEMYEPGGIVVNETRAKATPCACVEYKPDKFWCTSRGVVGALTDEQEGLYCNPREVVERPGIKERMARWQECVTKSREALPPTDGATRLEIYLTEMSKCLKDGGIEG